MRIVTTKGEQSLSDLVSRVFQVSGPEEARVRQAAERALLEANPHLRNVAALPAGAAVVVPEVPGAGHAPVDRPVAAPAALAGEIRRALGRLGTALAATAAGELAGAREALELVKSREIKALGKKFPELNERLPGLAEAAAARVKDAEATASFQKETIAQAVRDLSDLAARLA